jgi:hypothetical protein
MRKFTLTFSFVFGLVLFGLVGNVYGQIDTVMPNRFLNQDPYKLKHNLDNNPDTYDYLNNRNYKSSPTNFGYGTGIYYQWGFYGGEISNFISGHRVFFYPIMNFDFYFKRFMFQFIMGSGSSTVTKVNINADNFTGTFYGKIALLFNIAMGYEVFRNSDISIIPNIGLQKHDYSVYVGSDRGILGHGHPLTEFTITSYSFGLMADYKILKMKILHDSYVSIRFKYDYCFTARLYEYYNGPIHQFTIGLATILRDKKNR